MQFSIVTDDRVSYALGLMPERLGATIRKRWYAEKKRYVGKKRGYHLGKFTKALMRRKRKSGKGKFSITTARMFSGMMRTKADKNKPLNNVMEMGLIGDNKWQKAMINLQEGYTRSSSKFIPLPEYDNLADIGITSGYYTEFKRMAANNELFSIRAGGQLIWVHKDTLKQTNDIKRSIMFIGSKRIRIHGQNWGFIKGFETEWPRVQERLMKAIERDIRAIEKKYVSTTYGKPNK